MGEIEISAKSNNGQHIQGEWNGLWAQLETLLRIGVFYSRIMALRLESKGRVIPHMIEINNENQGSTRGKPHQKNLHQ